MRLNTTYNTTITRIDGTYIIDNITPGEYEIQALKLAYDISSKNVKVVSAKTEEINSIFYFLSNSLNHFLCKNYLISTIFMVSEYSPTCIR
jgi:hypothetical protein